MLCPNVHKHGSCPLNDCLHFHPGYLCQLCGVTTRNQAYLDHHLRSNRHAATLRAQNPQNTPGVRLPRSGHPQSGRVLIGSVRQTDMPTASQGHAPQQEQEQGFVSIYAALEEAESDKYGVKLSPGNREDYDLGIHENGEASLEISVQVDNHQARILLLTANMSNAEKGISGFEVSLPTQRYLSRNPLKGAIKFNSRGNRGIFQGRVVLVFYDKINQRRFAIVRHTSITVGHKEDYETLKPVAPYVPKRKTYKERIRNKDIIDGEPPAPLAEIEWVIPLGEYKLPKILEDTLKKIKDDNAVSLLQPKFISFEFDMNTHAKRFHALLHMEEYQSALDIQRYDQEDASLTLWGDKSYSLLVPGLAEKRPSLIVGDRIIVKHRDSPKYEWWRGYVHVVELDSVVLKFNNAFRHIRGEKFDVRFEINRLTLRRMHQALDVGGTSPRLLFPKDEHILSTRPSESVVNLLNPIHRPVGQNYSQMLAVTAIRDLAPGSPPFVVFGPPGTGKTLTIVEAIRQILWARPDARILACAPSNSAADIIAERLTVLGKSQLFRLNAPSRSASGSPPTLREFSRRNGYGTFEVPPKVELSKFRVIVSTCLSASVLYGIGIPAGHFSHIFVDEAGQACEPESLIPIKTLSSATTNTILSGDPKQLGPVIRSNVALKFGFGTSLLERLTKTSIYDEKEWKGITIVKLLQNFRSHPAIIKFPNEQFYRGELECKADQVLTHSMLRAGCIVKPGFPLVFHAIAGKDAREADSPSFFNLEEASLVKKYVQDLKGDKRLQLKDEHIGIISPYHGQCMKIRKLVSPFASGIKVGSVEEFQGQERRVIIVSTVRSNLKWIKSDIRQSLGFVASARRFNVAMTRAQALLIVIGNSNILSLDPLWHSFLDYIYKGGGWTGNPLP
ncbi:hypothetical protein M408DRAFT_325871, partial [Serendipita vermifera MAFF 305830]